MLLSSLNGSHQAHISPSPAPAWRLAHSTHRCSHVAFAASLASRPAEAVADAISGQWRPEPCSQPAERLREYENNIVSTPSVLTPDEIEENAAAIDDISTQAASSRRCSKSSTPQISAPPISAAEAARRQKISITMQQRWQSTALDLRGTLRLKMKGKEPWNKGRQMSDETRQKMSAAKLARRHSATTRAQMSKSHMGLPQPESKGVLISSKLIDRPKSQRHREAIATAQRRRLAAHRVLQAIEAVHRHSDVTGLAGAVRCARTNAVMVPGLPAAHEKQSRAQVLDGFQGLLHEFRSLQQELGPWTAAFQEQHARKPRMTDVEKTGIPWLESKYKQYIVMRERVLTETQALRDKLLQAVPDMPLQSGQQRGDASSVEKTNANRVGATSTAAATRMASALAYRSSKLASAHPPAPPASTVIPTSTVPPSAADTPAAAVSQDHPVSQTATSTTNSQPQRGVPVPNHGAAPRVRTALMAAAEYRRKKVEETVAAAQSAADSARLPPSAGKVSARKAKAAAAAAGTGAATLITGHKFEGRQPGQARKAVQKLEEGNPVVEARDIEIDAVSDLAADLDAAAAELLSAQPLASITPA
ncbi:hypothetical protein WJX73_010370 [Symbiochloris irregularis]|uniref:Nuclease associated modular domain-containing protein n=1 Tax=Symbiochloris irregularis TaxID=706552 RepID=A0AAW1PWB3_9CHLO